MSRARSPAAADLRPVAVRSTSPASRSAVAAGAVTRSSVVVVQRGCDQLGGVDLAHPGHGLVVKEAPIVDRHSIPALGCRASGRRRPSSYATSCAARRRQQPAVDCPASRMPGVPPLERADRVPQMSSCTWGGGGAAWRVWCRGTTARLPSASDSDTGTRSSASRSSTPSTVPSSKYTTCSPAASPSATNAAVISQSCSSLTGMAQAWSTDPGSLVPSSSSRFSLRCPPASCTPRRRVPVTGRYAASVERSAAHGGRAPSLGRSGLRGRSERRTRSQLTPRRTGLSPLSGGGGTIASTRCGPGSAEARRSASASSSAVSTRAAGTPMPSASATKSSVGSAEVEQRAGPLAVADDAGARPAAAPCRRMA